MNSIKYFFLGIVCTISLGLTHQPLSKVGETWWDIEGEGNYRLELSNKDLYDSIVVHVKVTCPVWKQ